MSITPTTTASLELNDSRFESSTNDDEMSYAFSVFNPPRDAVNDVLQELEDAKEKTSSPFGTFHRIDATRCVKHESADFLDINVAGVMIYIAQNTSIPVPKVLMAFIHHGRAYIVMEYIDMPTLRSLTENQLISEVELELIAGQLVSYAQEIKSISSPVPTPHTYLGFGDWRGGPYRNNYFFLHSWETKQALPAPEFSTVKDFHNYWCTRSNIGRPFALPQRSFHAVLAHGDLAASNILINEKKRGTGIKIAAIIDWDTFGRYPDFWEPMTMLRDAAWGGKWEKVLGKAMEPFLTGDPMDFFTTYQRMLDMAHRDPTDMFD
ncbi:kinase-like domain-containing protein [Lyophyllum atratum]|nr:kinase-like domain-containing protein [Lyophyllum atratum]